MITVTDLFAGAGGSSTGAIQVPGVEVVLAANHWSKAIEVHNRNHPDTLHVCADLSQMNPRYVPTTDILWASPECTNHSIAKGRRDARQPDLFGEVLPDEAAERSRATMWDVPRFTEYHRYQAVIVENVVEIRRWAPYSAWLNAMDSLGYEHHEVYLNSMHANAHGLPAPQSRDRIYVVFWRRKNRRPDLEGIQAPPATCPDCGRVRALKTWKKPHHRWGRYRAQYTYNCPKCYQTVEPDWLPAAAAIDWSIRGERIGDRTKPLAEKTRARIAAGIARYWRPIHLENAGNTYDAANPKHARHGDPNAYYRAWPVDEPLKTIHTWGDSKALAVPPLALRFYGTSPRGGSDWSLSTPVDEPLRTLTTAGSVGLVAPYYGSAETAKPVDEALGALTTRDRYALVTRHYSGDDKAMSTPVFEAMRTLTTTAQQSIVTPGDLEAAKAQVDDCEFRMLQPHEVAAGMAFPDDYIWEGTRRERVKMAGNAVTPPAARDLVAAVVGALA
ncbi:MAG: DNA cytosine methyltransferase [Trueperaceae bacterium]